MYSTRKSNLPAPSYSLSYLEYLPRDYGCGKKFPLVLFLHGYGEQENEAGDNLDVVSVHGYMKYIRQGMDYPFIMIAPQCPKHRIWSSLIETLNVFLDDLLTRYEIDENRIYLTGLSMGGYGTWLWAQSNPERFAAVIPVCGGGVYWYASQLAKKPVWAFHGEADTTVPVTESIQMIQAIRKAGGHPKLTIYPGVGHDSWEKAYDDRELISWMLQQHL